MALSGNFLILVAFHKVSSFHPPSKLLYRCLERSDLFVSIISQPFIATYWMSLLHEEWYLCRLALQSGVHHSLGITFSVFVDNGGQKRRQTSRSVFRAKIQTNCNFKAHVLHSSNLLGTDCRGWFMLRFRPPKRYVV